MRVSVAFTDNADVVYEHITAWKIEGDFLLLYEPRTALAQFEERWPTVILSCRNIFVAKFDQGEKDGREQSKTETRKTA